METIKLYAFNGLLVTDSECFEYAEESGATMILYKEDAKYAGKAKGRFRGYKLSKDAKALCKEFAKQAK